MALEVRLEQLTESELPQLEYRWDVDTDILCAMLRPQGVSEGVSGSLDIEGSRWISRTAGWRPSRWRSGPM
jgi:hypothetical protein